MKSLLSLGVGLLAVALLPGVSAQTTAAPASATERINQLFGDEVIARGQGFEIKRSQLEAAELNFKGALATRGQFISPAERARLEQQLLRQLIRLQVLLTRATAADKAQGKEAGDKRFEALLERVGSETTLARQLKPTGITPDELHTQMIEEATAEAVVEREIPVTITDEEARKFYDENPARFEEPERVRVSHILLSTQDPATHKPLPEAQQENKRRQIEDLLKRARAGEDFAKLAEDYSEDSGSRERGGEYPPFARGQMVPEFEAVAFALGENQISDVVTTAFGFHIIKLHERLPARVVPFDTARERIREGLRQQAVQKQLPDYFGKLYKEANVKVLDEKLKPAESPVAPEASTGTDEKR